METTLGFIGFGKMANAICRGVVSSGFIKKENIFAYDINLEFLEKNTNEIGINHVSSTLELSNSASNILIATKPFVVQDVINQLKGHADNKLIISILAGITIETYEKSFPNSRVVRVMPNTPAMVNAGMSAVSGGRLSTKEDIQFVCELFSKLGEAVILDEAMINAVTAVSGSGPAFYYYIIDKIAQAGAKLGLDYGVALKLSAQTALGASKMIMQTGLTPVELINAVTTPNGTTAEGNGVLVSSDIEEVLFETIKKTYDRAVELGLKK